MINFLPISLLSFNKKGEIYIKYIYDVFNYILERKLGCYLLNNDEFFIQSLFKSKDEALKIIYRALQYMKGSIQYNDVMKMKKNEFLDFLNTYVNLIQEDNKK